MPVDRLFIPMRDGVRLAATLYRPETEGPWPALLEALPYRKDDVTRSDRSEYERLRAEGDFAVCRVDVRGTGSSEGVATDEYPPEEQKDLGEVIAWLAEQEWCTGNVGMFGTSYSGFNSIQVAMEQPPALKAIVPIYATDDRYADDVHYFGGALKALDVCDYPLYMTAMNALPPVPALAGPDWREKWRERVESNEPWVLRWLEEQIDGPYWRHGSLRPDYHLVRAATLLVQGWADGYTNNSFRTMEALTCPKRLLLGPWAHASTETSLPGPRIDLVPEMIRWFDRWLRGTRNGIDEEPPILLFACRSTRPEPDLDEMRGEWRFEPGWPLERVHDSSSALRDAATPGRPAGDLDALEVRGDVGVTAWISCAGHLPYGQPDDQRPDEIYSLVYDWPQLERELEILGHPRLEVTVRSSAPVAYLSAKLCDVFPDGTSSLVTRGMLNLAHRDDRTRPTALEPGAPYRVTLELEVASWVFEEGHRVRLDIAGADWPNAWPPPEPATLTIDRSDAVLFLPEVDGPTPVDRTPSLSPSLKPRERRGNEPPAGANRPVVWRVERDVLARETRAIVDHGWTYEGEDAVHVDDHYAGTFTVSADDPGRARAEGIGAFRLSWPEVTVESEARLVLRSDRDAYHLALELDVREEGGETWARTWDRTIKRKSQ